MRVEFGELSTQHQQQELAHQQQQQRMIEQQQRLTAAPDPWSEALPTPAPKTAFTPAADSGMASLARSMPKALDTPLTTTIASVPAPPIDLMSTTASTTAPALSPSALDNRCNPCGRSWGQVSCLRVHVRAGNWISKTSRAAGCQTRRMWRRCCGESSGGNDGCHKVKQLICRTSVEMCSHAQSQCSYHCCLLAHVALVQPCESRLCNVATITCATLCCGVQTHVRAISRRGNRCGFARSPVRRKGSYATFVAFLREPTMIYP